jgi:hypothetical protein
MQRPLTPTFAMFGLQVLAKENESMPIGTPCQSSFSTRRLPAVHNVCEIVIEGYSIAPHTRSLSARFKMNTS